MPKTITIAIEGPGAGRALDDLLGIEGIEGHAEPAERGPVTRDGGLFVAVGAIVGIAVGVAEIVSKILEWRDRLKKAQATNRLNIVIEDAKGNRLLLDNATPEQITAVLQTLDG